ncbi:MAG: hypothetical protein HY675_04680 [Chloroflexi bacterium]|nr:hypothetical protein [Chloroflexota bacterium]
MSVGVGWQDASSSVYHMVNTVVDEQREVLLCGKLSSTLERTATGWQSARACLAGVLL